MTISVDLQIASEEAGIPNAQHFEAWVNAALAKFRQIAEVSIRIVDATESQQLNYQYRHKDKPTNVLSFPFDVPDGIPSSEVDDLLGDLVICASVVEQEALDQQKKPEHHWAHMVVHGTLHLLGFDHINENDALEMEQLEREILASLVIPDPYFGEHEV